MLEAVGRGGSFHCISHGYLILFTGFFRDTMGSYDWIFYINGAVGAATGLLWIFEPFLVSLTNRSKEFPKADVQVV